MACKAEKYINPAEEQNGDVFGVYEVDSADSSDGRYLSSADLKIPKPNISDDDDYDIDPEIRELKADPLRTWQFKLSKRKKEILKVKSRMKSCQLRLEEQDEQLKSLQEQIAKRRASCKKKTFDWTPVRTAHLISKVFEFCEPVKKAAGTEPNNEKESEKNENDKSKEKEDKGNVPKGDSQDKEDKKEAAKGKSKEKENKEETAKGKSKDKEEKEEVTKSKCLYTADFHRFAIALYFFSPKAYFFLSNIAPMFPHRNYIRQWVTSGRVEKLFPQGVYRDEFNETQ